MNRLEEQLRIYMIEDALDALLEAQNKRQQKKARQKAEQRAGNSSPPPPPSTFMSLDDIDADLAQIGNDSGKSTGTSSRTNNY